MPSKIVIAGSGRIAWHLGKRMKAKGIPVAQVLSRTAENARALADVLQAGWTDDWAGIIPDADWLLVAVRDDAIA
ncbi:MAG: NAD(P)-binding domain-containing protein [Lewinellaceae bacterium]|nr:NAD(P)-binding domain-containing protein [Lewinellaceae bacterium]